MKWISGLASAVINLEHVHALEVRNFDPTAGVFAVYAVFGPNVAKPVFRGTLNECDLHLGHIWASLNRDGFGVRRATDLELLNGPGLVPEEPEDRSGWSGPYIPALVVTDEPR
jgi:hypothetical protein